MNTNKSTPVPPNLESFWMPFTANRMFKSDPRMLVAADGMYYTSADGRKILDGSAGLWCCNAGHNRPRIMEAFRKQSQELDYAPCFHVAHPKAFELANRISALAPEEMNYVFYTNSGSEAIDTALKIAIAYHRIRGQGERVRLIGRERSYHGVNFAGIAVGGMVANRKMFGTLITGVDHLPHTHDLQRNAFTRGMPEHGIEYADALERLAALHDPSTIAAVIVEPVAGSTGVLPPPQGYLQRLRQICDKYGILLIFDEVITAFGRLGAPFGAQYFGVTPDIICVSKGLTGGVFPLGATIVGDHIYDAFMSGPKETVELFHGYTYSGHPFGCAVGLAVLDTYEEEGLLTRATDLAGYWEDALFSLQGLPLVTDLRNLGLMGGIDLAPIPDAPGRRGKMAFNRAFDEGLLVRLIGDSLTVSPPLIISKPEIDQLFDILRGVLQSLD